MLTPILATKIFIPPPRPRAVLRPNLVERLNEGLHRKLTLISAPAGFGKTTLISKWVASCKLPVAFADGGAKNWRRGVGYSSRNTKSAAVHRVAIDNVTQ